MTEVTKLKREEIKEEYLVECDEHWSEVDKQNHIQQLITEQKEYEQLSMRIQTGFIPPLQFEPTIQTGCYLFGCVRHNHPDDEQSFENV